MIFFLKKNILIIFTVKLKKYIPYTNVFYFIISKFCDNQEPYPVIFFIINKSFKINFYYTLYIISLVISFIIESGKNFYLILKK